MERTRKGIEVGGRQDLRTLRAARAVIVCATILVGNPQSFLPAQEVLPGSYIRHTAMMPVSNALAAVDAPWDLSAWPVYDALGDLAEAEADLAAGIQWEERRQEACVDLFYRAAVRAWKNLESSLRPMAADSDYQGAWQTYQRSLAHFIPAASRFGRLDPRSHLIVNDARGRRAVRIAYHGFSWKPGDFCEVIPAAEFHGEGLHRYYWEPGLGASLVAVRHAIREEQFSRTSQPFAVTAILHARADRAGLLLRSLALGGPRRVPRDAAPRCEHGAASDRPGCIQSRAPVRLRRASLPAAHGAEPRRVLRVSLAVAADEH